MRENLHAPSSLPGIIVLVYHRIDNIDTNPWGVCVSPKYFEEQINFLKNNFNVISSRALIHQLKTGNIQQNTICITFDDGYADNYLYAKPILEKYNCPATFFIPTAFINQTKLFWWDSLEIILLHAKKLPGYLLLQIDKNFFEYWFDESKLTNKQWLQHINWKWYEEPPTNRCAAFLDIWKKLRSLLHEEINKQINSISEWADIKDNINEDRLIMNEHQLQLLSEDNLFTIGLHTHTHPDMEGKEKHFQMEEILSCKKNISKYNAESNCLAYPYGKYDGTTIEIIKELEITACFTTDANIVDAKTDMSKLGRYQVFDWDVATFRTQLNRWF